MVFTNHTERNAHRILYVGLDVLTFRNKKKKTISVWFFGLSGLSVWTKHSVFSFCLRVRWIPTVQPDDNVDVYQML